MSQTPPSGNTVVDLAIATPTLSTLVTAVKAAGLATTLSGTGPFTVFAPTNAAFAALGAAVPTLLLPANKALLVKVLEYHVVSGTVLSSALTNGATETTLEGQKLNISVMNSMVMVNKASINGTQVKASNGVVHVINKVLLYPGFALPAPSPTPSHSKPSSLVARAKKLSTGVKWLISIAVVFGLLFLVCLACTCCSRQAVGKMDGVDVAYVAAQDNW